jgi:hypothetical protein
VYIWSKRFNNPGSTGTWGEEVGGSNYTAETDVVLSEGSDTGRSVVWLDCAGN